MGKHPSIQVWPWPDAPAQYQNLSFHGGERDWVALIPAHIVGRSGNWRALFANDGPLSSIAVNEHPQPDGSLVLTGGNA